MARKGKGKAAPPLPPSNRRTITPLLSLGGVVALVAAAYFRSPRPPPVCEDLHEMCFAWHKAGYCEQKALLCPRTCGRCPGVAGRTPPVPHASRCQRDNHSAAVPAYHLNSLFQRAVDAFPQYEPQVLSTDPWLVRFRNFLSTAEANAFQEVCLRHFERSLAGDQLNPVRTSDQCWCNFASCFANEHVHRVTTRINTLLGLPYDHGEELQVVRYNKGQFYRSHHDQNSATWTPQGPRVLTFFMYLNDVPKGGETAFPRIGGGVEVAPRVGDAILWPSTYDDQPMLADMRTMHEARPVEEGVKFGANLWVHQFSFKTPSERGCELTFVNTVGDRPLSRAHQELVAGKVPTHEETLRQASRAKPGAAPPQ
ncbi:hypothetical protein AB1Y20_004950 [Prymnesium parvum]|uniref:Fe2OG dioxygenase domain-containing protein n=1 Tax=Prymnesium parvum TaxID=97485 RepID=A0AB34J4J4_PRYPA